MQKSGDGGVSREGSDGMDDESIAAAMEAHFAPFASAKRSLAEAAAIAGEMGAAHAGDEDDADPEVTAITRKYEENHDTLGAINELQQLLIGRTGQIPIIPAPQPEPGAATPVAADVTPVAADAALDSADSPPAEPLLDWSLTPIAEPAGAPGFSPWVDPELIAAAQDDAPARTYSDVSTQVFSVFAAKPEPAPAPEAPAEPLPPVAPLIETAPAVPAAEPEPMAPASAPLVAATGSVDITPQLEGAELDEDDDVIDDTDRVDRAVHALPTRSAAEAPPPLTFEKVVSAEPAPQRAVRETPEPPVTSAPVAPPVEPSAAPEQKRPRRRWWPFGRR